MWHSIDEQPKEAAISLLRTIAYHKCHSRRAEERDLEERLRYHEASRRDAEESCLPYIRLGQFGQKKLLLGDWNMWERNQQKLAKNSQERQKRFMTHIIRFCRGASAEGP